MQEVIGPGPKGNVRRFLEAVIWILRSGAPWRDLVARFGPWQRVYRRYQRRALAGRRERLRGTLGSAGGARLHLIDSTVVKAHAHAAGALKRLGHQALGRSRGGFTTKLHASVSERGELVRYLLTGGEVADITQAQALVCDGGVAVVGDKAYDSDAFVAHSGLMRAHEARASSVAHIASLGACAVIPSRSNRKQPRALDKATYRERNIIERWFGRVKTFRRVATRYEKTALSYLGMVAASAWLVAITGWST